MRAKNLLKDKEKSCRTYCFLSSYSPKFDSLAEMKILLIGVGVSTLLVIAGVVSTWAIIYSAELNSTGGKMSAYQGLEIFPPIITK